MTGSTPTATDADLQRQILQENLLALRRAEERAKREDERREEKHRAKMAALTGSPPTRDEPKGETIPQVLEISKCLPGIPRTHLLAIFEGKFDPYNLHKLRALHADEDPGTQQVSISEAGSFQIQKPKGKLKDYGASHAIWQKGFLNYTQAMAFFFESTSPTLSRVLTAFHLQILKLDEIYSWKNAVLPLTLTHHSNVVATGQANIENWTMTHKLIDTYCTATAVKARPVPLTDRKRKASPPTRSVRIAAAADNTLNTICKNWNLSACIYTNCSRQHACSRCDGKHTLPECKVKTN